MRKWLGYAKLLLGQNTRLSVDLNPRKLSACKIWSAEMHDQRFHVSSRHAGRFSRVALSDGGECQRVKAQRELAVLRFAIVAIAHDEELIFEHAAHARERDIVSACDQLRAKRVRRVRELREVVGFMSGFHFSQKLFEVCALFVAGAQRDVGGERHIDGNPNSEPVYEVILCVDGQTVSSVRINDETFACKLEQRLAHGRSRYAIFGGQIELDQALAWSETALLKVFEQHAVNLIAQPVGLNDSARVIHVVVNELRGVSLVSI